LENIDHLEMLMKIAKAQTSRFPNGDEPFKNGCRILEEAGEVVWELNHFERKGISIEKGNADNKEHLALEAFQLCEVVCQLLQYFDLSVKFKDCIEKNYKDYIEKGYIK
jgi:NTP pyrophosphatase (non-canonical NTP hydrolase)